MQVLSDLIHIFKFILFSNFILGLDKKEKKNMKCAAFVLTISSSFVLSGISDEYVGMMIYVILVNIVLFLVFEEKPIRLMLISIWLILLVGLLDKMSQSLIKAVSSVMNITIGGAETLFSNFITIIFISVVSLLLKSNGKLLINKIKTKYLVVFTVLTFADAVVLIYLSYFADIMANTQNNIKFKILFVMVILGTFLQLALVLLLMVSRNVYAEKEAIAKKFLEEQKDHYRYLELREEETKKFRHDSREHIHMLKLLYNQDNKEEFSEYLGKLTNQIDNFGHQVSVGNDVVDGILNKYCMQAEKENIKLYVKGKFPRECFVETFDLCIIFSNIIKNAIEAEKKTTKNYIELSCGYNENEIIISCENDYTGNQMIKDGMVNTNKKDRVYHGWGLENVQECVDRNAGFMNITTDNNKFKIVIIVANEDKYGKNSNY